MTRKRAKKPADRKPVTRDSARGVGRYLPLLGAAALLAVHWVLAATSIQHKCTTFDEIAHLTKGYAWWTLDDKRLVPEHPPLAQAWAALPLLNDDLKFPSLDQRAWHHSEAFTLGKQFFYRAGNDPDRMLGRARQMMILLSVVLGGVVFWWSRKLFGTAGGLVSLTLYAFSPTILANCRLVTTDLCVSLFFLLGAAGVWWVLHRVSIASVLLGSAALLGLFLSKMSAVLIIPVGLILLAVRLASGRPLTIKIGKQRQITSRLRMTAVLGAVAVFFVLAVWAGLWAAFGFRYQAMVDAQPERDRFFAPSPPPADRTIWEYQGRGIPKTAAAIGWARERRLLPEAYLYGFLFTVQSARGRDAFLNGERNLFGWWYFFPLCFLYKVPLAVMAVMVLAAVALATGRSPPRGAQANGVVNNLYRTAPLWALPAVYWAFALTSHLNIGHRHLLPTFAPMFVLCGVAAGWFKVSRRWVQAVVPVLLGLLVVSSVAIKPHYLAYFNAIAGGPSNGYRHLVDSSLDWGQDLPGLKRWLDEHRGDQPVYVSYFGTGDLDHYGVTARRLPQNLTRAGTGDYRLEAGWYCISATRLQQLYMQKTSKWTDKQEQQYQRHVPEMAEFEATPDAPKARSQLLAAKDKGFRSRFNAHQKLRFARLCAYLRDRKPDEQVGHSILIYNLTDQDIHNALTEPRP